MREVFYKSLILSVAVCCVDTSDITDKTQPSLNFMSEVWDKDNEYWKISTAFTQGSNARLRCTTDDTRAFSSTLKVRKLNEVYTMVVNSTQSEVIHHFGSIDCYKSGTYVCENGHNVRRTIDIGMFDCEPRLCNDKDTTLTIYSSVNKTENVSLCVQAYPEIHNIELLERTSIGMLLPTSTKWSLHTETTAFAIHTITLSLQDISEDDFSRYTFDIATSYQGRLKKMKYTVDLKMEGPPDCPSDVQITSQDTDYVTLSWQPGTHGGAKQSFQVYSSMDNETWQITSNITEGNNVRVGGLKPNTLYAFRIVPRNKFTVDINEALGMCDATVYYATGKAFTLPLRHTTLESESGMRSDSGHRIIESRTTDNLLGASAAETGQDD